MERTPLSQYSEENQFTYGQKTLLEFRCGLTVFLRVYVLKFSFHCEVFQERIQFHHGVKKCSPQGQLGFHKVIGMDCPSMKRGNAGRDGHTPSLPLVL